MEIEKPTTLLLEGDVPRNVLANTLTAKDELAKVFLRAYQELAPEEVFALRTTRSHTPVRATIATGIPEKHDDCYAWHKLSEEGWQLASLAHWYVYAHERHLDRKTLVIGGTTYRDELFQEWVPMITHTHKFFHAPKNEITMRPRTLCFPRPRYANVLLVKFEKK